MRPAVFSLVLALLYRLQFLLELKEAQVSDSIFLIKLYCS